MTAMSGAGKGGGRGFCDGGDRFAMEDHFHKADPPETMSEQERVPVLLVAATVIFMPICQSN